LVDVLEIIETPPEGEVLATKGAIDLVQNPLWLAHLIGFGERLRVSIAEPLACINTAHEAFRGVTFEEPVGSPCTDTQGNNGHSTKVASALAAFVGDPGSIDLVGVFNGTLFTSDLCTINDDLIDRMPHLVNLSCVPARQPALDYAVFTHRIFVANGSGNSNQDTQPVYCDSYNSVCVGGYNHFGTLGLGNFEDDAPAGRWINEPTTHREKPDLIGPYRAELAHYNINDRYDYDNGTSFSTPFVVGTAGLLISNYSGQLHIKPTLTRAVLMASASHPMAGYPPVPIYTDNIDDRAGAGAPRGDRGRAIMKDSQYYRAYVDRNVDFDANGKMMTPISFHANAGEKVRVVLTYDQCQDDIKSIQDALLVDIDLVVRESSLEPGEPDIRVHTNNSHVDNSEIIEFMASASSQIHVNANVQHWDQCSDGSQKTYLAIAWDILPTP
jgi:subtilisin family serine protease